jgi:hypothetical protein
MIRIRTNTITQNNVDYASTSETIGKRTST